MALLFLNIVAVMTTLCYVTALPCAAETASANCSFEHSEPCSKVYTVQDEHGLKWWSGVDDLFSSSYDRRILQKSSYNRYMYMRGTLDSRVWGLWTDLTSPTFRLNGGCLQFSYHNSVCGNSTDSKLAKLKVTVRSADDATLESVVRTLSCKDRTSWESARVPLSRLEGAFQIVFSTQHHGWVDQVVAVDHVLYTHQTCSSRDDDNFEAGDCDWENGDPCGYHQTELEPTGGLRWEVLDNPLLKDENEHGSMLFRSIGRGSIMHVTDSAENSTSGDVMVVNLYSPKIRIHKSGCLALRYYSGRFGAANNYVTALTIQATNSGSDSAPTILRELPATLGEEWLPEYVPLRAGEYSLMFTARILLPFGSDLNDLVAIDDLEINHRPCDDIRCQPTLCDDRMRCNGHTMCIGDGLKHYSCRCRQPYIGKSCEFIAPYSSDSGFVAIEQH